MKKCILLVITLYLFSCNPSIDQSRQVILSGTVNDDVEYLIINSDTTWTSNGSFLDTLNINLETYGYIQLSSWKWGKLIHLNPHRDSPMKIDFSNELITVEDDLVNNYYLNKDSILIPYTAKWDMTEDIFRQSWQKEMPINFEKIDSIFKATNVSEQLIFEAKQVELMLRAHLTSNFVSYQKRKGNIIDPSIYAFVKEIDLNNERLSSQINNRNFQYFYFLDTVSDSIPEAQYPFAAIDTIYKYVKVKSIRNMIYKGIVKSALYNEEVNHDSLFKLYRKGIGTIEKDDEIFKIYNQIQKLKPQNPAPTFGPLKSIDGSVYSINDFLGKNILISVWGTWCPYCRDELPDLIRLGKKYKEKLLVVAISLDKDEGKWKTYIETNNWNTAHLIDPNRNSTFRNNYLINGTNVYYLIDTKGNIVMNAKYKPSSIELEEMIDKMN